MPAVRRHAAKHRHHVADHHPLAIIDDLAITNRLEQFVMLVLIHVRLGTVGWVFPQHVARGILHHMRRPPSVDEALTLGAGNPIGVLKVAIGLLSAIQERTTTIGPLVHDGKVVIDIAAFRHGLAQLATAHSNSTLGRLIAEAPVHLVHRMHRLLHHLIA